MKKFFTYEVAIRDDYQLQETIKFLENSDNEAFVTYDNIDLNFLYIRLKIYVSVPEDKEVPCFFEYDDNPIIVLSQELIGKSQRYIDMLKETLILNNKINEIYAKVKMDL